MPCGFLSISIAIIRLTAIATKPPSSNVTPNSRWQPGHVPIISSPSPWSSIHSVVSHAGHRGIERKSHYRSVPQCRQTLASFLMYSAHFGHFFTSEDMKIISSEKGPRSIPPRIARVGLIPFLIPIAKPINPNKIQISKVPLQMVLGYRSSILGPPP